INNEYKINLRNDKTSFLSYSMIGDFVLSQILALFGFSKKDYSYDANPLVSLMQNERKLRRWLISKLALFLKYQIKLYPRNENNDLVYISDLCVNNSAEKELLQRILQAPQLRQQLGKNFSSQSHDDLSANLDEAINSILIKKSNMSPFKLRFEP
ncbi:MAG: hypothetical protein VX335_04060, partial [Pseudomonadota bacterium]|nr:hypothetical protein [Pseudomonadota bacterium]